MYRVLVVEDNDKIRLELCDFLSKNGYAADSCTNFEHIMEEIKAKRPDLILLDLGSLRSKSCGSAMRAYWVKRSYLRTSLRSKYWEGS